MSNPNFRALQPYRHHHIHAHFSFRLRYPVLRWSHLQRAGYLRGGSMQEEDGLGHLRAKLGHS